MTKREEWAKAHDALHVNHWRPIQDTPLGQAMQHASTLLCVLDNAQCLPPDVTIHGNTVRIGFERAADFPGCLAILCHADGCYPAFWVGG